MRVPTMRIPSMRGVIDRRILVNYRVDPAVLQRLLPAPFRPLLVRGYGIAGICLIRLKDVRPAGVPPVLGFGSENAAHRVAVQWDGDDGLPRSGVYVLRRDTSSRLAAAAGGRLFPGRHRRARFDVREEGDAIRVQVTGRDDPLALVVEGRKSPDWPDGSVFRSLEEASSFFERGAIGWSERRGNGRFEGLELKVEGWAVEPLSVSRVESSFFDDRARFPAGSLEFDDALLMRDVPHAWHAVEWVEQAPLPVPAPVAGPCA